MAKIKTAWLSVKVVAQSDLTNDYIPRTAQRKKSGSCAQIKAYTNTFIVFLRRKYCASLFQMASIEIRTILLKAWARMKCLKAFSADAGFMYDRTHRTLVRCLESSLLFVADCKEFFQMWDGGR